MRTSTKNCVLDVLHASLNRGRTRPHYEQRRMYWHLLEIHASRHISSHIVTLSPISQSLYRLEVRTRDRPCADM